MADGAPEAVAEARAAAIKEAAEIAIDKSRRWLETARSASRLLGASEEYKTRREMSADACAAVAREIADDILALCCEVQPAVEAPEQPPARIRARDRVVVGFVVAGFLVGALAAGLVWGAVGAGTVLAVLAALLIGTGVEMVVTDARG